MSFFDEVLAQTVGGTIAGIIVLMLPWLFKKTQFILLRKMARMVKIRRRQQESNRNKIEHMQIPIGRDKEIMMFSEFKKKYPFHGKMFNSRKEKIPNMVILSNGSVAYIYEQSIGDVMRSGIIW